MGKGIRTKHTSAELQRKADLHKNKGGGKDGKKSRKVVNKFRCLVCGTEANTTAQMKIHYDARHPREVFDPAKYVEEGPKKEGPKKVQKKQKK